MIGVDKGQRSSAFLHKSLGFTWVYAFRSLPVVVRRPSFHLGSFYLLLYPSSSNAKSPFRIAEIGGCSRSWCAAPATKPRGYAIARNEWLSNKYSIDSGRPWSLPQAPVPQITHQTTFADPEPLSRPAPHILHTMRRLDNRTR